MKKSFEFSRRRFLKGCGAALALPYMESLQASKKSSANVAPPIRLAFFYIPNGVEQSHWNIENTGRGDEWQLSRTLSPLNPVKNKLLVLSNLDRIKVTAIEFFERTDGLQMCRIWGESSKTETMSHLLARECQDLTGL